MEKYTLRPEWSYELAPQMEPIPAPEPRMVRVNTRYRGLRWDIGLDTSWTYRQVWEAVETVWADELR
jgi:hypothetical protein